MEVSSGTGRTKRICLCSETKGVAAQRTTHGVHFRLPSSSRTAVIGSRFNQVSYFHDHVVRGQIHMYYFTFHDLNGVGEPLVKPVPGQRFCQDKTQSQELPQGLWPCLANVPCRFFRCSKAWCSPLGMVKL